MDSCLQAVVIKNLATDKHGFVKKSMKRLQFTRKSVTIRVSRNIICNICFQENDDFTVCE